MLIRLAKIMREGFAKSDIADRTLREMKVNKVEHMTKK